MLTSRYPTGDHGFSIYAGILTGKGNSTGHTYQAEGSNEASYKNLVSHSNGSDGDFTFTSNLHLRDLSYEDNGVMYHNVREIIVKNDGNTLTESPENHLPLIQLVFLTINNAVFAEHATAN